MEQQYITISELGTSIKGALKNALEATYWIVAEISELSVNNGHCYIELIEKDEKTNKIKAKIRAMIWSYAFRMIKPYFESVTGRALGKEMKILVQGSVEYHELYGLSFTITNINPNFTLGEIVQNRQKIIEQLQIDGVFDMNRELELELVPQKIAIISSETAAGYGDFINQIQTNSYRYRFDCQLFAALVQGDSAPQSIIEALERINDSKTEFDVVVIIRGGGSKTDLSCFDSYELASNVAQFPIPILTGIGHERDESIVDLVAHTQLKTPTAVAEFLIGKLLAFESYLIGLQQDITKKVSTTLQLEKSKLDGVIRSFPLLVKNLVETHKNQIQRLHEKLNFSLEKHLLQNYQRLDFYQARTKSSVQSYLLKKQNRMTLLESQLRVQSQSYLLKTQSKLQLFESVLSYVNPENTLKRGYTLTKRNGKIIKSASQIQAGDGIETVFYDGKINSQVI